GQIGLADHADQLLVLDHGHPLDQVALHLVEDLLVIGVGGHPARGRRTQLGGAHGGGRATTGHALHHDVAVGDDAAHALVLVGDDERADAEIGHHAGRVLDGVLPGDPL